MMMMMMNDHNDDDDDETIITFDRTTEFKQIMETINNYII